MNAALQLTRANLLGHDWRIQKVYGASVIGLTLLARYDRAQGLRNQVRDQALAWAVKEGRSGFQPTGDYRCSPRWHYRAALTAVDRARLEREGRVFNCSLLRRQAC